MTKQIAITIGLFAILALGLTVIQPGIFQDSAVGAENGTEPMAVTATSTFGYGRLVFEDDQYNWIAGKGPVQRATSIRNLITRLGGQAPRADFAALLDTLGANGWELIFETEDPEGYGQVLVFKRSAN